MNEWAPMGEWLKINIILDERTWSITEKYVIFRVGFQIKMRTRDWFWSEYISISVTPEG